MNMKLKRGIAVLVPVLGIAVVGAVGAQSVDAPVDPALVAEPEGSEAFTGMNDATIEEAQPVELTATAAQPEPVAAPEPVVVERSTRSDRPVRVDRTLVQASLPPAASPRSGEGSGEEIATRTMPVDERASLVPEYQVDHSPGL